MIYWLDSNVKSGYIGLVEKYDVCIPIYTVFM